MAFGCVFDTPISDTLAQTFSNCFLFHLLLFSGSLATSCCQNADKNKMAELWTLVFKVKLSFHTKYKTYCTNSALKFEYYNTSYIHSLTYTLSSYVSTQRIFHMNVRLRMYKYCYSNIGTHLNPRLSLRQRR